MRRCLPFLLVILTSPALRAADTRNASPAGASPDFKNEIRYFITSLEEEDASHTRLAEIARGHWSVENRNHWRKDATLWRENRSVRLKSKGARNLALLRSAILAIIQHEAHASLN